MSPSGASASRLLYAVTGFLVWSLAFVVLYGGLSIGCRTPLATSSVLSVNGLSLMLALLLAAHLAALGFIARHSRELLRQTDGDETTAARFLARLAFSIAVSGFASTLWIGFPILFLLPCA